MFDAAYAHRHARHLQATGYKSPLHRARATGAGSLQCSLNMLSDTVSRVVMTVWRASPTIRARVVWPETAVGAVGGDANMAEFTVELQPVDASLGSAARSDHDARCGGPCHLS